MQWMSCINRQYMASQVALCSRRRYPNTSCFFASLRRSFSSTTLYRDSQEPRLPKAGRTIRDEYATLRSKYQTSISPVVLAHGLMGFDELRLVGNLLPGVHYWRGITEALIQNGNEVILTSVPPSASIEDRAAKLSDDIEKKAGGKSVNIIAHSMGGLDARYMISQLKPPSVHVRSLTTIATPHHGSAFADYLFERIGEEKLPKIYSALRAMSIGTGAFSQLTRHYMENEFNPRTPDREGVAYFSYGAHSTPPLWSAFRQSHRIIEQIEGANDGLVSVTSSQWGTYKGTLENVSHLDLINWTNRLRWLVWEMMGNKRNFNAVAFYLDIVDMLAKEGY